MVSKYLETCHTGHQPGSLIITALLIFITQGTLARRGGESLYRTFYFDNICPAAGDKQEIHLGTGAAIFKFDELNKKTKQMLQDRDLLCHIEVETDDDHGFHVYIDEMSLDIDNSGNCQDYLQFGRDVLFFTTAKSQSFCGQRSKIEYGRNMSSSAHSSQVATSIQQGNRLYIEEKDDEMDIWLKVRRSDLRSRNRRSLSIIVTVFKKTCQEKKDRFYTKCARTNYCIRHELLCDGYVNCAWPSGDLAMDESNCTQFNYARFGDSDSSDRPLSNRIPVAIIITIIIVSICMVASCGIMCKRVYATIKEKLQPGSGQSRRRHQSPSIVSSNTNALHIPAEPALPLLLPAVDTHSLLTNSQAGYHAADQAPNQPPSYEDAIKNYHHPHTIEHYADQPCDPPPSYSASAPPYEPS